MAWNWHPATLVERVQETSTAFTLHLDVPEWPGHLAGQHLDVRLTAPDGYTAARSYSIASAPDGERVQITVQRVDDGEVSPYLADELPVGASVEVSRPRGGWFVWRGDDPAPLLLVGGGSGVVPLMAVLRTRLALPPSAPGAAAPVRLVYSARTPADVIYADELARHAGAPGVEVLLTYTREAPDGAQVGRLGPARHAEIDVPPPALASRAYVCGPNGFVEAVASTLVELGHDPRLVRTERFGPTG
ncbi:ferredoxin-NADP reductase [Motilibacter peucedani]|uniref:Ferredoxin-NADP reductase n=1 Tax=Motilibacter peucedani TaxID=598650 RepID=A0A420XU59_9ACTN|nr:ferredoxin reductase [Motilibacter peucedani]RKS80271.1 ferredoxin-NADP reductase [Motilibacter peucedani]